MQLADKLSANKVGEAVELLGGGGVALMLTVGAYPVSTLTAEDSAPKFPALLV
jgi:hypothetical protein